MTTAALASMALASPRVPEACGMLSCLGGFSPRMPPSVLPSPLPSSRSLPFSSPRVLDDDLRHLEHDPKLAAKIMRKRQQEAERGNNRLTPRMQRIGLDIAALNMQVTERRAAAVVRSGEDQQLLEDMRLKGDLVRQAEEVIQADRRQQHMDCVNFSFQNLRKDQRREWFLSDPRMLKAETPARVEGIMPAMSSMQKFEGELGVSPEIKKEKRDEQVKWLMSQMAEKKLRLQLEKDTDRQHDAALLRANELRAVCTIAAMQEQRADVLETARENEQIASARSARQESAREREVSAKRDHAVNVTEHNLMREKHDYSIGLNGKKRDYKRCSYEEEVAAWDTNRALAQAKRDRERSQVDGDGEYRRIGAAMQRIGDLNEGMWHRGNLERRQKFDAANVQLAKEKRENDSKEKQIYTSYAASP